MTDSSSPLPSPEERARQIHNSLPGTCAYCRVTATVAALRAPSSPAPRINGFVDGDPTRYGAPCVPGCEQPGEHIHIPPSAKPEPSPAPAPETPTDTFNATYDPAPILSPPPAPAEEKGAARDYWRGPWWHITCGTPHGPADPCPLPAPRPEGE